MRTWRSSLGNTLAEKILLAHSEADEVLPGDPDAILVTGWNFGIGSSREHVPLAMQAWGVQYVLGRSFARIFRCNCVNLGLPILECPEA